MHLYEVGAASAVSAFERRMYMSEWCLYGNEIRERFERDLKPEYLLDQIGKARNSYNFKSVPDALESQVSVIQEYLESVE